MGTHKNKTYSLRLPNELRLKVEYIANSEFRDFSKQYELMITDYVNRWQAVNGNLVVGEDESITIAKPKSVKPGKSSSSKIG